MDVAHLEAGAVPREAAGAEGREAALVGELGEGVVLVHELGQGARAEELLDGGGHRADVDQRLGGDDIHILGLQGHALADHPLHAGKADAELVLQKLAHAADAAVAEVVDVIGDPDAVIQPVEVVDRGEDIVHPHGAADELVAVLGQQGLLLLGVARLIEDGADAVKADTLVDAAGGDVEIEEVRGVHRAVGDDLALLAVELEIHDADAGGLGGLGARAVDALAGGDEQLAGEGGDDVPRGGVAGDAAGQGQLLVHLVPAKAGQVIPAGVKEEAVQVALGALDRGGLAGAQLAVGLKQALLLVFGGVLFEGGQDPLVLAEKFEDLGIGRQTERADEHRDRQLAVFVDADIEHVAGVGFKLEPGAAVGVHGGGKELFAGFVVALAKIDARAAHQLADDDPLGAVDDEGAGIGHERKIAHEDLLLLDLAGLLVEEPGGDPQRRGIGGVPLLALLDRVLGLVVEPVVDKIEHEVAGVILDGRDIPEDLPQPLVQKPLVGIFLHLDEVGHPDDLINAGKTLPLGFAEPDRLELHHENDHSYRFVPWRPRAGPPFDCLSVLVLPDRLVGRASERPKEAVLLRRKGDFSKTAQEDGVDKRQLW